MTARRLSLSPLVWTAGCLVLAACGGNAGGPAASGSTATAPAPQAPPAYLYTAPVAGHYQEVNTGDFDLVDGLATPGDAGGTVVLATSKPIGSPLLAGSACPRTEARALMVLRDASWLEVPSTAAGDSPYFAAGSIYDGQSYEENVGGGYWKIDAHASGAGRIAGRVRYGGHGGFEFDLPLSASRVPEVSEGERAHGQRSAAGVAVPDEARAVALYRALRDAARARDLAAFLAAQGFSADRVLSIRGLAGIDADFAALADRFLTPGEPGESSLEPGRASIGAEGTNSKGAKFFNFYELAACGDRLLLVGIGENPQ